MRDRESLFNEYILEVRRREKDEKIQKKETVSMNHRIFSSAKVSFYHFDCFYYESKSHYY